MSFPINSWPEMWSVNQTPAATTQATISKAAVAGVRHCCTSISFALAGVAAQPAIQVNLRDGATGAGTILWSMTIVLPVGGFVAFSLDNINIPGTAGNAMTLETSAAPASTNQASVAMTGFDN